MHVILFMFFVNIILIINFCLLHRKVLIPRLGGGADPKTAQLTIIDRWAGNTVPVNSGPARVAGWDRGRLTNTKGRRDEANKKVKMES